MHRAAEQFSHPNHMNGIYVDSMHGQDWSAFTELVEPFRMPLIHCIGLLIGDFDEANSLAQETFVRAWSARQKLKNGSVVYPWLRAIAVNLTKQTLERRRTRALVTDPSTGAMAQVATSEHSVLSELVKNELMFKISLAVQQLPDAYREAVVLHYVEGMDYESISQLTGVSTGLCEHGRCVPSIC